ncbi:hypothetical protein JCM24511_04180 [Saitozyma sp. JCM 24511]|nr:hypothetical protein JCM24511_04180 [Saitozyma sp. JCM 24511]
MLSLVTFALLSGLVRAQDTLLSLTGSEATVYYDLTNSLCGDNDPFTNDWAETSGINNGVPYCEGSTDKSLADLGTNRIVAVNATMMQGDPSEWCGKDLFIWDACAAATSSHIVDLSAKAFTELKGGTCGGNNPTGLTINILNSNVWEAGSGGGSAGASASGGSGSGSGSSATSSTPSSTSAAVPVASSAVASSAAATSRGPSRTTFASASQATQTGTGTGAGSTGAGIGVALAADDSGSAAISASATGSAAASSAITSAAAVSAAVSSAGFGNTAATAATAASSASSSSSASTSGDCTYGAWQCDGLQLQVCNYVSVSSLGWETIETCTSTCDVTSSGSIDCE